ncbi:MAG TPA: helix-turn-helix domain-containing protein [Steroidobacteraceae bacterium]|nr:helix-turn-helix domain-containing protein [Gammaproteobacteria bacterium]HEV2284425.1 helix-turn-helix domain-containing protein [Steroidobacteraceae bacterium]
MKITPELTDAAVLEELGARLVRRRIDAGLTQAQLAEEAGVSKRTVERIEAGRSTDFAMLLRTLRALKALDALDQMVPDLQPGPLALLRGHGRTPRRVRRARRPADGAVASPGAPWKWRE